MYNTDPKTTTDMVFAEQTSETIIRNILSQKLPFPMAGKTGLLFYGTFGTGKTTYAEIFCNDFDEVVAGGDAQPFIEFVACDSSEKINTIIKRCESIRSLMPINLSPYHYFIFDEVDNLTKEGQRKLKSFLNHSNIVCVLTTNYLHEVDDGLRNRCHAINFNAAATADYLPRIKQVLANNNLPVPNDAVLTTLIENAEGSWRDIIGYVLNASANLPNHVPPPHRPPQLRVV